jgi:hypothetical protein
MKPTSNIIINTNKPYNENNKKERCYPLRLVLSIIDELRTLLGKSLSKNFIASPLAKEEFRLFEKTKEQLIQSQTGESIKIQDAQIDAFIIKPDQLETRDKKWIIVFNGMQDRYEHHIPALQNLANDVGANVVAFNYRDAKTLTADDLVSDGISVIEALKMQGILEKDILVYGHSAGGGIAAKALQQGKYKIPFVSESSFGSFADAVEHKKGRLFALLLRIAKWNVHGLAAFKALDENKKAIIVKRNDPTVAYQASLYKKYKEMLRKETEPTTIKRIKIGRKLEQESLSATSVLSDIKECKKNQKSAKPPLPGDYKKAFATLKKRGLIKYLIHPHHRLMDQQIPSSSKLELASLPQSDQELIETFNAKFIRENTLAYKKMIELFKDFLSIQA